MVYVFMKDGKCIELPEATRAEIRDGQLLCYDNSGFLVVSLSAGEINSYTLDEQLAETLAEEVCEETTIIEPAADGQTPAAP